MGELKNPPADAGGSDMGDSIQPLSCREMLSSRVIKFEISDLKFENFFALSHIRSIDLHSPADPFEM